MRIQIDANQDFRGDAIDAVLDVLEGQPLAGGSAEVRLEAALGSCGPNRGCTNADDEACQLTGKSLYRFSEIGTPPCTTAHAIPAGAPDSRL